MGREYNIGDVLVYMGDEYSSKNYIHGKRYIVEKTATVDYYIDDLDSDYGKKCVIFEKTEYGCYYEFADENFIKLDQYRLDKINDILDEIH